MIVQCLNLNDLLTLPAGREHWALLPVVYIDRLLVEWFVIPPAEVARFVIHGCALVLKILLILHCWLLVKNLIILLCCRFIGAAIALWLSCMRRWSSFGSFWVDIGLNDLLSLLLLGLLGHDKSTISSSFCQHLLNLIYLCLTKATKFSFDFITKIPVKLNNASLCWLAYVLEGVNQPNRTEIQTFVKLLLGDVANLS